MKEMVSIITPLYNSEEFIKDTVDSVLSQTYTNWEMVIVDDASTDKSVPIIQELIDGDGRVKLLRLPKNVGAAQARNRALELCSGRFIAFLDSDDVWYPEKLEKQLGFMLAKNIPISYTSYELINEFGHMMGRTVKSVPVLTQIDYLKNTIIGFSTSMIDANLVGNNFRFTDIRTRQDASLWITLLGEGFCAYGMKDVMVKYRIHRESISSNKVNAAIQVWKLYFRIHRIGLLKSAYYFIYYAINAIKKRM